MSMDKVVMPHLGEGILEGTVRDISVSVGDTVVPDQILCQVETAKTIVDIESSLQGRIQRCLVKDDEMVQVGAPLFEICPIDKKVEQGVAQISPKVRAYAKRLGLTDRETSSIKASGEYLSIIDIEDYIRVQKNKDNYVLSPEQKGLIHKLDKAKQYQNAATISISANIQNLRQTLNKKQENLTNILITNAQLIAYCASQAAKHYPPFWLVCQGKEKYRVQENLHIGVAAIAEDNALQQFVLSKVENLSLFEFIQAYQQNFSSTLVDKAYHIGCIQPSFNLSFLGHAGPDFSIPSLVFPSIATLFVSKPITNHSENLINLVLTFDHNVLNGNEATSYLNKIKEMIEGEKDTNQVKTFEPSQALDWVSHVVCKALGVSKVSPDGNLGECGIDSIMAVNIVKQINQALNLSLSPITLWQYPTVRLLSKCVIQNLRIESSCIEIAPAENEVETSEGGCVKSLLAKRIMEINEDVSD